MAVRWVQYSTPCQSSRVYTHNWLPPMVELVSLLHWIAIYQGPTLSPEYISHGFNLKAVVTFPHAISIIWKYTTARYFSFGFIAVVVSVVV